MEFSDFIAPFAAASFRTQYYGQLPLHIPRNGDSRPSLLPWSRFNQEPRGAAGELLRHDRPARREADLRERLGTLAERIKAVMTSPAFAIDVLNHQRDLELLASAGMLWQQTLNFAAVP